MVPAADEHLASALRRARRITPNSRLKNEAAKARNKAARQMDGALAPPAAVSEMHPVASARPLHANACHAACRHCIATTGGLAALPALHASHFCQEPCM